MWLCFSHNNFSAWDELNTLHFVLFQQDSWLYNRAVQVSFSSRPAVCQNVCSLSGPSSIAACAFVWHHSCGCHGCNTGSPCGYQELFPWWRAKGLLVLFFVSFYYTFAELQSRIQAMEKRCYCKMLCISYKDHVTNEEVHAKIQQAIRPHKDLLTIVKRGKLQWYGHVSHSLGLAKTILQGKVKWGRRQGRQRKMWEDNIREWTGLKFSKSQRAVENKWKMEKTGCNIIFGAPTTHTVKG